MCGCSAMGSSGYWHGWVHIVLSCIVYISAVCAVVQPWEGLVIGMVGSMLSNGGVALLDKLKIDDPVGKDQMFIFPVCDMR